MKIEDLATVEGPGRDGEKTRFAIRLVMATLFMCIRMTRSKPGQLERDAEEALSVAQLADSVIEEVER